jgi:hypothetical protein
MHFLKKIIFWLFQTANKNPLAALCCFLAFSLHLTFFFISWLKPNIYHSAARQKLIVNTHQLPSSSLRSFTTKHESPKTSTSYATTKEPKASSSTKKIPQTKAKTPAQKHSGAKTQQLTNSQAKQLLQQLQKNLAEIETQKEVCQQKQIMVPQSIKQLKADETTISSDLSQEPFLDYHNLLINFLKTTLELPVFGTVKLTLTLDAQGHFKALEILASDSEVNRFYLEKQLKELEYPVFTKDLSHQPAYSFNLTFCSDQ